MVLKRYLACQTFSKCHHTAMRAVYPYLHTLIKSKLNQLHNCICGALSIKDGGVINIFAKSLRKRTIELQIALMILHCNVKVTYSKSI